MTDSIIEYLKFARDTDDPLPRLRGRHPRPALRRRQEGPQDLAPSTASSRAESMKPLFELCAEAAHGPDPVRQAAEGGGRRRAWQRADRGTAGADPRHGLRGRGRPLRARHRRGRIGRRLPRLGRRRPPRARERAGARCAASAATPLWALADSHRISDLPVVGGLGEIEGFICLDQRSPTFYAKQVVASVVEVRHEPLLPPFFGKLMAYDGKATIAFDCRATRAGSSTASRRPGSCSSSTSARRCSGTTCVRRRRARRPADPRGRGRRRRGACGAGLRRRPTYFVPQRHEHVEQGRHRRAAPARAIWCCSTATITSRCTRARWCRPARCRSSCRPRATRSA